MPSRRGSPTCWCSLRTSATTMHSGCWTSTGTRCALSTTTSRCTVSPCMSLVNIVPACRLSTLCMQQYPGGVHITGHSHSPTMQYALPLATHAERPLYSQHAQRPNTLKRMPHSVPPPALVSNVSGHRLHHPCWPAVLCACHWQALQRAQGAVPGCWGGRHRHRRAHCTVPAQVC